PRATTNLCIENCGFYGTLENGGRCSVCFKKIIQEYKCWKLGSSSWRDITSGNQQCNAKEALSSDAKSYEISSRSQLSTSSASDEKCFPSAPSGTLDKTKPNRCFSCRRRVGLAGFKCRCGNLFCSVHRYSEEHNCTFDYTARAKKEIAANNPIVKPPKIHKI
ncbi:hypothetical protein KP509_1Z114000, partial [Ceratopteris richardii]